MGVASYKYFETFATFKLLIGMNTGDWSICVNSEWSVTCFGVVYPWRVLREGMRMHKGKHGNKHFKDKSNGMSKYT